MNKVSGNIVFEDKIFSGSIKFDTKISEISPEKNKKYSNFIIPGFIDLHCHGGNGFDAMEGIEAIINLSNYHLFNGTTTLYPTTVTASLLDTKFALKGLNKRLHLNSNDTNIEGIHLEGPFINPDKLGAQPPFAQLPNFEFVKILMDEAPIKIMTVAPEIQNGLDFIEFLTINNIKPQIGHTLAGFDCCNLAIKKGVESFTHLYNAMSGFDHRNPGAVASAFSNLEHSEIICDLIHVHKDMIKLAYNNISKLYVITDCISAAGMPDGKYKIGSNEIHKKDGVVKLNENTLGGSILTMNKAFKNLLGIGFSINEAVRMTSTNAAKYLSRNDIGQLSEGCVANFLVIDSSFDLLNVFLNGKKVL